LQAIREETEKAITEALGESGLKKYKTRGGWWISNLSPTPSTNGGRLIQVPATIVK
jgi:hypothetical protein